MLGEIREKFSELVDVVELRRIKRVAILKDNEILFFTARLNARFNFSSPVLSSGVDARRDEKRETPRNQTFPN